ncbi:CPBP family intramembrane glutamic endopeptidase [Bacillus cereus]|uniref:CPBP family intramembrane glutamic endopeptidase n=1 Tax=Bacillus cereus TaxID=1396 RepID=UPI001419A570|nr:CPBP family intramembrane glutamic endopeptidase [Bacillus cereus]
MQKRLHHFIYNLRFPYFIILMTIATFVLPLLSFLIPIEDAQRNPIEDTTLIRQVISGCVVAPLIETALYQMFLFWILKDIPFVRKYDNIPTIFLSAIIFGTIHSYGLSYIVYSTLMGVILGYSYWIYQKKKEQTSKAPSAYWVVFLIHALHNLFTFLLKNFF